MSFHSLAGKAGGGSTLLPALTFSIAFHFLMLWPAYPDVPRQAGSLPLAATLRAAPTPVMAATAGPAPAAPAHKAVTKPALPRAKAPAAAIAPDAAAQAVADAGAAGPAGRPETASIKNEGVVASGAAAGGPDADGVRDYRIGLAREARSHRRYPPLALERGWTGTVEIQVDVSRQGHARQVLLARSSGHEILDREALTMMSRAAAAAALPASLRGQAFAVRLPVVFDLADVQ